MVKIRLKRMGSKKAPYYRIVVMPARSPRDGRPIDLIGTYNPRVDPPACEVTAERARHWLEQGAQPTPIVRQIFKRAGVFQAPQELATGTAEPESATKDEASRSP